MQKNLFLFGIYFTIILQFGCAEKVEKPNILFIMTDDHASHAISAYGGIYSKIAPTPNIDRLANEGVLMNNVFCTNAICGPSRAAILTGKYSHMNGYLKNYKGGRFDNTQWTFPKELQANGYQTAIVGKWHLASEPTGFDYYKYHVARGEQGFYWNPVYNDNGDTVRVNGYATNLTTNFALNWLDERNEDNPFCLMLQFKAPHRPWQPDSIYQQLFDDIELPYPSTFNDDYQGRELTAGNTEMTMNDFSREDMKLTPPDSLKGRQLRKWIDFGIKRDENVIPKGGMSEKAARRWKYQRYMKDYLATIRSVDDNIGKVLAYLDEKGLTDNTIVIYTSDQGFFLGDHGWFDKRFMYEQALRMPFLVRYPNSIKAGVSCNDVVTNIDFAPTILEMAGLHAPDEVQGRSFFANLNGETPDDWRQSMYYHYYEYPFWHHVQPHYGIRNQRYKLIHFYYDVDVWELYDLQDDPNEMINLINSPEHQTIVNQLKVELKKLKVEFGNTKSIEELRGISDTDFGGLESGKH
ncbi:MULTISPECIES: sulfatase family protein [unclassified Carboxylicivirga]|uniref:sulfatase family protein n=1 Tax=Carboxylicivirga TaxID=1628153 RepID=UPI003D346C9E